MGDSTLLERLDDGCELRTLAAQHGCGGAARHPAPVAQPLRDVGGLLLEGGEPGDRDVPAARTGAAGERLDGDPRAGRQRCGDVVRHVEDGVVVAPARRQRPHGGGLGVGEVGTEAVERGRGGPAPPVDGLVRVTDGGDGDGLAGHDEQVAQELELGLGGVLELVEEDGPVARPLAATDLGDGRGDACREGHLVGEVHGVAGTLQLGIAGEQRDDGTALPQHGEGVAHRGGVGAAAGLAPGDGLEGRDDGVEVGGEGVGVDEVLGQLAGEVDQGGRHGGLGLLDAGHVAVPRRHGLVCELPGGGLAEQPALGLDPESQPVLADDARGVRVVGGDGGPVVEDRGAVLGARGPEPGLAQGREPGGEPLRELARRLAREGETEHLVGLDEPVGDEEDDPGGHRLGLARPGAGDDEEGP